MNKNDAFLNYNQIVYDAASPALGKAAEIAKENGNPYGKHITTTPNNLDRDEGRHCHDLIQSACEFTESMYDWSIQELEDYINKNSSNDFIYIGYTWRELGKDEVWYNRQVRQLSDPLKIKREIDLQWTLSSDVAVFTEEELERIQGFIKDPIGSFKVNNYLFKLFKEINKAKTYAVTCDVGGGTNRDSSVITVVDLHTNEIVAHFKNNRISTFAFKELLYTLITTEILFGPVIIERNSYGLNILDDLTQNPQYKSVKSRVFYTFAEDSNKSQKGEKTRITFKGPGAKTKKYGVNTDVKSRENYFSDLNEVITNNPELINVEVLFKDIRGLENHNGKVEHSSSTHDDTLLSWLIFRYATRQLTWRFFVRGLDSKSAEKDLGKFVEYNKLTKEDIIEKQKREDFFNIQNRNEHLEGKEETNKMFNFLKKINKKR